MSQYVSEQTTLLVRTSKSRRARMSTKTFRVKLVALKKVVYSVRVVRTKWLRCKREAKKSKLKWNNLDSQKKERARWMRVKWKKAKEALKKKREIPVNRSELIKLMSLGQLARKGIDNK
jgi:hypothetical protein